MATDGYALEHFYYGQFVRQGKPEGDLRLLAASPALSSEQITDIVRTAAVPPLPAVSRGAWALVRSKAFPFVLVQSQLTEAGAAMLHFIVIPVDALRALGGNLRILAGLFDERMPVYDQMGSRLQPLPLERLEPPAPSAQEDAMLALMMSVQDRLDVIEILLASIIQGVPLIIRDAPADSEQRLSFIEGLLALLPPPARYGVTFTLHALPTTRIDAQIRFALGGEVEDDATVYVWPSAQVTGSAIGDDYSRFIVSQLRLDTSAVLEQTTALTSVASWRIRRGDTLAEALGYASYRLKIDNALLNSLPVTAEEASRVLAEDPTLNDTLRTAYVRHVLAFALALGDMRYAEPVAVMLRQQADLEHAVMEQMSDALQTGKAHVVYDALSRWLANPLGPTGMEWTSLAQAAGLIALAELVKQGDIVAVHQFLRQASGAHPAVEMHRAMPRMIEVALPLMGRDAELASILFVLAAHHLPVDAFERLLKNPAYLSMLPEPVQRLAAFINGQETGPAPSGLLTRVVGAFPADAEAMLLIRLTEVTLIAGRVDLVDSSALSGLVRASLSPHADAHDNTFRWIVRNLSTDEILPTLDDPGPRHVLQILLARRAYPELAHELLRHARVLYPGTRQSEYAVMVRRLFAETPVSPEQFVDALRILDAGGVKPLPLAMAHLGALKRGNWSVTLQPVVKSVTALLVDNTTITESIPPASLLDLLRYHAGQRDLDNSLRIANLFPAVAARKGEGGAAMMMQMFRTLDWDTPPREAALELMRRYIRLVDSAYVRQAVNRLGEALGPSVSAALKASYLFRLMMDGEDISGFAMIVRVAARFLSDTSLVYVERKNVPGLKSLFGDLDSLVGGLSDEDRQTLATTMMALGRAIITLASQPRADRPRNLEEYNTILAAGKGAPQNALDVLCIMGGYFARGQRVVTDFQRPNTAHPFADRAAPSLLWESQVVLRWLSNLAKTFPASSPILLTAGTIRGELESLLAPLPAPERKQLVSELSINLQRIPDLITYIAESGDHRALEETSGLGRKLDANRQQPQSTLEFYRFVHGYFLNRTRPAR